MGDCCQNKSCELESLYAKQSKTLWLVLWINMVMFFVEVISGYIAGSIALMADSLDMLGDTLVYAFSIFAVTRGIRMKAKAALFKGIIMLGFALFVLVEVVYKLCHPMVPIFETIGIVGILALTMNSICLFLLWKHQAEDINMKSVWLCSRNDIIANVSVIVASLGVWVTKSGWPDILVGVALAMLFFKSAVTVLAESIEQLHSESE